MYKFKKLKEKQLHSISGGKSNMGYAVAKAVQFIYNKIFK